MWASGMLASVFITIALVSLLIIATGFPIIDALTVFIFTGGVGAVFSGIVYAGYKGTQRKPTDPPLGEGESKNVSESWQRGSARGEEIADRFNSLGPAVVSALPSWTWTAGVLLGVVLHLSLWISTIEESQLGMGIGIIGGISVSFSALVADTHRTAWTTEYNPRWWFWSLLGSIPLFGWLVGLLWLGRKRQKT